MSIAAAHAHTFYRQVAKEKRVWTIRDEGGFPAPKGFKGNRAQPFWSSLSRLEKIKKNVPAYADFSACEITWEMFRDEWLPGLKKDGVLIGVNWSGDRAIGYDLEPGEVRDAIEAQIKKLEEEVASHDQKRK